MDGLSFKTIIERAEPLARLSARSLRAKADVSRRGPAKADRSYRSFRAEDGWRVPPARDLDRLAAFAMRAFATILICGAVLILAGCKLEPQAGIDPVQQLVAAKVAEVPLPATTPFDLLPSERAAYLEAYRDGYRSGLVSLNVLIGQPAAADSYYSARTNGWQTGVSAGFNAHFAEVMQRGHQ